MKTIYRHKMSGAITTDVIISANFVNLTGNLVSIRHDDETTYRTYQQNDFNKNFEEVVKSEDGMYVTIPTNAYLVSINIISSIKLIELLVHFTTLTERDKSKIFFISKGKALAFFNDVIKLYPDYELLTKDSGN